MTLNSNMICRSCGADFGGCENGADIYEGAPCPDKDYCPSYFEEKGIAHPEFPDETVAATREENS